MALDKVTCIARIKEMSSELPAMIIDRVDHYLRAGAVDLEGYDDDYRLPKILLTAALQDISGAWAPLDKAGKQAVKNLGHF